MTEKIDSFYFEFLKLKKVFFNLKHVQNNKELLSIGVQKKLTYCFRVVLI